MKRILKRIRHALESETLLLFLGAGASVPQCPSAYELARMIEGRLGHTGGSLPPQESAACFAAEFGQNELKSFLHDIFARAYSPMPHHRALAACEHPLSILTTNYDTLIEQAFSDAGRDLHVLATPFDRKDYLKQVYWWPPDESRRLVRLDDLPRKLDDQSLLYKLHGTVDPRGKHDSHPMNRDVLVGIDLHKDRSSCFLLSEDDYVRFWGQLVSRPPFWIGNLVYGKRLLFVGYSIRDLHVRIPLIIASWLTRENYKKEGYHWAIMPEPDPIEQLLWRSRYVEVLDAKAEILLPEILRGSDGSQPAA